MQTAALPPQAARPSVSLRYEDRGHRYFFAPQSPNIGDLVLRKHPQISGELHPPLTSLVSKIVNINVFAKTGLSGLKVTYLNAAVVGRRQEQVAHVIGQRTVNNQRKTSQKEVYNLVRWADQLLTCENNEYV